MHWDWGTFGVGIAVGFGVTAVLAVLGLMAFARGMSDD